MKEKKSLRDSINNLKQDNFPYDDISDLTEEPKEEKNYTLEELKSSLLDNPGLEEVVGAFEKTSKNTPKGTLIHTNVDLESSDLIGIPPGQYIGIGNGSALYHAQMKGLMEGAPRSTVEKSQVYVPLLRIENFVDKFSQADLVLSIKNRQKITDLTGDEMEWLLTGVNKITQLSIINKTDIIAKIEDTLENYDKLVEPKKIIQHFIKLKDMLPNPTSKMLYCDILNECVLVID
ncbi:hypothetical protein [Staphylococcus phage ZCSS1]|nr:hypothetical protein [Staphylococcus phage ZCSS1]